jgi:hypothetical protein
VTTSDRRDLAVFGAVACVACCAGPILGVLGGIGALGLVSSLFIGVAGLLIAVAAAVAFVVIRRRRARALVPETGAVPVELSRRP